MMDDERRLKHLRAEVRASYYCCRREIAFVHDAAVRGVLEDAACARWQLTRAIDGYLASRPAPLPSRLRPTLRDLAACLARRAGALLAANPDRRALRWLAADSALLRHSVEICRALTWSLEISDLLSLRLAQLKQVQRSVAGLSAALPRGTQGARPSRALAAG